MNEALATTPEKDVQGTEEVVTTDNEALQASEEKEQEVDAQSQDTEKVSESDDGQGKKPSGFQRRMAKFEAAIEKLVAENEYWKEVALKGVQKPAVQEPAKSRLDFATDDEWIEHRLEQERQKLIAEAQNVASQTLQQQKLVQTYQTRLEAVKKEYSDWDAVFQEATDEGLTMPQEAVDFCLESDVGPKIAYHLAKNTDEYEKFIEMSPMKRAAYLGKLEDRLSKPVAKVETVKKVSTAPAKLVDTKGSGSVKTTPAGLDRFSSKEAWKEWRQSQKKR